MAFMNEFIINLAKDAGKIILKGLYAKKKISSKGMHGIVTDIDFKSEKFIVERISRNYPDHAILTEEKLSKKTDSDWLWLIDPIDGTTNFSQGYPLFCVSIAVVKNKKLAYGVVYAPLLDELFYAEYGKGAYLNGKRIHVSTKRRLKDAVLVTGFAYDRQKLMWNNLKIIGKALENRKTQGVRIDGSAAMDLCYVACGRYDGFWEFNLQPWDTAAAALIVMEAGGKVTTSKNTKWDIFGREIIASNRKLHNSILRVITSVK